MRAILVAVVFSISIFASSISRAQAPSNASSAPSTQDAQVHFERGLTLADDGNYGAAMVEFRYAYRLTGNPLLLYNIALAHQALGHYVEALESMRSYLADAGAHLTPARLADVRATTERLETRIGTLVVAIETPGLDVTVDSVRYDAEHARAGIRLSVGSHQVLIRALGYESWESPVDVVSGLPTRLDQSLAPALSGIALDSNVADAEVRVDDRLVGTTPIANVIAVASGRHHVELRREGYTSYTNEVDVSGPGTRLVAQMNWRHPMPAPIASHVHINAYPRGVTATIDGRPIAFDGRDALPPGVHHLVIEGQDFLPIERDLTLTPASPRRITAWLAPTPESARRMERRRASAGLLALVGGAVIVLGSTAFGLGVLRAGLVSDPTGWDFFLGFAAGPVVASGLLLGAISSVRYLLQPRPESYLPPRGRSPFNVSVRAHGLGFEWY